MKIRLKMNWKNHKAGEIITPPDVVSLVLIEAGYAKRLESDRSKDIEKPTRDKMYRNYRKRDVGCDAD